MNDAYHNFESPKTIKLSINLNKIQQFYTLVKRNIVSSLEKVAGTRTRASHYKKALDWGIGGEAERGKRGALLEGIGRREYMYVNKYRW